MELRADARANHEQIIEAATAAFAERGLGVEMKEIADRARVAVGTVYRHFPSKEDLLTAIGRSLIADAIADADACALIPDPIEALTACLAGNLRRAERYGSLIAAMIGGQLPRHHLQQLKSETAAHGYRERFAMLIQRAIERGSFRPDLDSGIAAAMLEGTTMPWVYDRIANGRAPKELANQIVATFLNGAAPRECDQNPESRAGAVAASDSGKG